MQNVNKVNIKKDKKENIMPTVNDSLMDFVSEKIIADILGGKLEVGRCLGSKRQLAYKYAVSRTVIDRALDNLVFLGYLKHENDNFIVDEFNRFENFEDLINFSKYDNQTFNEKEILDIRSLKSGLDCLSVKLITLPITDEIYQELKDMIAPIEKVCSHCKMNNCITCAEVVYDFYYRIAQLSGNVFIPWLYEAFRKTNIKIISQYINHSILENIYKKASIVLEALHSGDRMEAIRAIDSDLK